MNSLVRRFCTPVRNNWVNPLLGFRCKIVEERWAPELAKRMTGTFPKTPQVKTQCSKKLMQHLQEEEFRADNIVAELCAKQAYAIGPSLVEKAVEDLLRYGTQ